jgi:phosphatidylglycerophosphatase C
MEFGKKDLAVAFFDLDGTITTKDTFLHFIFFTKGKLRSIAGFIILSPVLVLYKLKLLNNSKAKEIVFAFFFKGCSEKDLKIKGELFMPEINKMLRPAAIHKINWHKQQNHKVYVVTASSEIWLGTWCKENNLDIIATVYEVKDGNLTGKISGRNCYGTEKVKRIKAVCDLTGYGATYAYGDSKADLPLLQIARYKFYKSF